MLHGHLRKSENRSAPPSFPTDRLACGHFDRAGIKHRQQRQQTIARQMERNSRVMLRTPGEQVRLDGMAELSIGARGRSVPPYGTQRQAKEM